MGPFPREKNHGKPEAYTYMQVLRWYANIHKKACHMQSDILRPPRPTKSGVAPAALSKMRATARRRIKTPQAASWSPGPHHKPTMATLRNAWTWCPAGTTSTFLRLPPQHPPEATASLLARLLSADRRTPPRHCAAAAVPFPPHPTVRGGRGATPADVRVTPSGGKGVYS